METMLKSKGPCIIDIPIRYSENVSPWSPRRGKQGDDPEAAGAVRSFRQSSSLRRKINALDSVTHMPRMTMPSLKLPRSPETPRR